MTDNIRKDLILSGELVLVLRCNRSDMTSYNDFPWPTSGPVEAPAPNTYGDKSEWKPDPICGNGLHGWLWGAGDISTSNYWQDPEAKWVVVEVLKKDVVEFNGKCKFPRGNVVFAGNRTEAVALISAYAPPGTPVIFGTATAGYHGTATAGVRGTATAGDGGTATAGYHGTATAGVRGTATAGDRGTATAGYRGTATAGDGGTATAGDRGTATAGYRGTATAGDGGTATAGDRGAISLRYWDPKRERYRVLVAEIDAEGDYKPNTAYVVESGKIVAKKVSNE